MPRCSSNMWLMQTEGVTLDITDGAIDALADVAVL
jgi:hypothetical protein